MHIWKLSKYYFQGSASTLLATMEREKELLRIFLKVSQMENTILRRMNLSSFLMVSLSVGGKGDKDLCDKEQEALGVVCCCCGYLWRR